MYTWLLIAALSRAHLRPYTVTGYGLGWITLFIFCGDFLHTLFLATSTILPRTDYVAAVAGAICLLATQLYPNFPKKQDQPPDSSQPPISLQSPIQSQELPKLEPIRPVETTPIETTVATTAFPEPAQQITPTLPTPEPISNTPPVTPTPKKALQAIYQIDKLKVLLTPRERQVMFLLTQGRNYKAISEKLGITPNTVKFHIGHIYDKFGVYSKHELLELLENQASEENHPVS
jgi:DNA-binding CsgD family transcriptional regulator